MEKEEKETIYIPVTGKQLGFAIATVVFAISSYPVANWINPDVRSDPFTGTQGEKLSKRINNIDFAYEDIENRVSLLEHDVIECRSKQDKRDASINEGQRRFNLLWDKVITFQAFANQKHVSQDEKIKDCMRTHK